MIRIIDFGSQTTHLISRRIRELGSPVEITTPQLALEFKGVLPDGIIFSGGPASVYEKSAPTIDKKLMSLNIPILGICYGEQLISYLANGRVRPAKRRNTARRH